MTYCQGTWSLQRDGCTYSWRWQNNWSLDNFCPFSGSPWRPEVYSFSKNNSISLYNSVTTNGNGLQRLFSLPLSPEAYDKFQLLINSIGDCHLNSEFDRWNYIWGNPAFSTRKAYLHLKGQAQAAIHPAFKWLRKSNWQTKHKILFWLILKDRFNTRSMLRRRNMDLPSYACILCDERIEEDIVHLFLGCQFSKEVGA